MSIPTVPGSEVQIATPQRGATLDPGAFQLREGAFLVDPGAATAPARASLGAVGERYQGKRAVAGAVGNASGALEGIADDLLKAKRAQIAADADFRMRAAQQSFVESLRGDGNEGSWGERAKETYEQTRSEILDSHNVPPGMRRELDASMRSWGQALTIKAGTMAAVQSVNRAEVAIRKSYDEAGRDGDAKGMANAVALGRSSKLDPVEMDRLEQGIPRALALTAIENGLQNNPVKTRELLLSGASLPIADQNGNAIVPKKALSASELQSWTFKAHQAATNWQSDNFQELLAMADPKTGLIPEDQIRQRMEDRTIKESVGTTLLATQARTIKAAQKAQADYLHAETRDPTLWMDNPDQTAEDLRAKANAIEDPKMRQQEINAIEQKLIAVKKSEVSARQHDDQATYNRILAQADNHPAWADAIDERAAFLIGETANIGDSTLRQKAINYVNHQEKSLKKTGALDLKPVETETFRLIKDSFDTGFSNTRTTQEWKKESTPESRRAVEDYYHDVLQKMRAWFDEKKAKNEKIDFNEADEYRRRLTEPWVSSQVTASLFGANGMSSGAVSNQTTPSAPQYKTGEVRRQNGKTYKFNGQAWDEVK